MARKKKDFPTDQLGWRIDRELVGVLRAHDFRRVLEALVVVLSNERARVVREAVEAL